MPELPEVETMRRGILEVVGCEIAGVERPPCRCKPIALRPRIDVFRRRAVGKKIDAVDRIGKRVVLRLSGGDSVVMEPRMTGLVLLADPPNLEHLRFRFDLKGGKAKRLLFWDRRGLGSVRLFSPQQMEEQLGPHKLGPDALAISAEQMREQLHRSRRAIKVALLDQKALAGVGNLYASELLHVAGVHPQRRCDLLTKEQWQAIHQAMLQILHAAIRAEGSTLSDGTYRNALNQSGGYQNQHLVYDRADQSCQSCQGNTIRRIVQAQRSTFFCPTCQTKSGGRKK